MREDHDCAKLTPIGARASASGKPWDKGLSALGKFKTWGRSKLASETPLSIKPANLAKKHPVVNLNALKAAAKGDSSVPAAQRVYVFVEASADTTKAKFPTGKFFYSANWSIGRVLDAAAKALQVENVNNRGGGEAEKLRIFHVEGGRLLEFSEKLGDVVQNTNTLVLLRGVGPQIPDMIEP
jgi:AN1-type zinc finger protein 1